MKRNKFAIITAIVLGSFALWLYFNNGKGTINESWSNFAIADPATVNKIILKNIKIPITLERRPSGNWMVNGKYPANGNAIKSLLYTFKNIEIKAPVCKSEQERVLKDLSEKGILCEIYQDDLLVKAYYVGKVSSDLSGTYMAMIDIESTLPSEKAFITYIPGVESNVSVNYFIEERAWRDRTVFQYDPVQILSVKLEVPLFPQAGYELFRKEGGGYQVTMLSTKQLVTNIDSLAVKQYLSYFAQLNFESFESNLSATEMSTLLKSAPLNILTVTDITGKTNKVQFYPLKNTNNALDKDGKPLKYNPERMLALLENGKDLVVVKFFEFGKVMPPAAYFQSK